MILSQSYLTMFQHIFIIYIVLPLSKAITIYSVMDCVEKKKINKTLVVSFINVILTVLTFAGRGILLDFIFLIVVIISCSQHKLSLLKTIKQYKKAIVILAIILVLISTITNQRKLNSESSLFSNAYSYYVGSIHLFDVHLNEKASLLDDENLLYGKAILSPIIDIYKMTINFFGFNTNIKSGVETINQQVQQYYRVGNHISLNNNVTFLYVPLRDFGIFGLLIGPLYLSFIYAIAYKKKKNLPTVKNKAIYYYLCSILPYFIFEFYLNKTNTFFTIIFILVIPYIFFKKGGHLTNET